MELADDFQEYLDNNLEDMAESHIEAYKDRYSGYTIGRLESDLDINYDDSCEIENIENALDRQLDGDEVEYFRTVFYKQVVCQFFGLPDDYEGIDALKDENEKLKRKIKEIEIKCNFNINACDSCKDGTDRNPKLDHLCNMCAVGSRARLAAQIIKIIEMEQINNGVENNEL